MRLLPSKSELGWLPYGWLIYLAIFASYPLMARSGTWNWVLTMLGVVAFLPLYFWGYWLCGTRVLMPIAGIAALGCIFAPMNPGSSVFFVYAACFCGEIGEPVIAVRYLGALLAIVGAAGWFLQTHPSFWIPGLVFTALMGGVDIHQAQRRRMNRKLRMAQEEIEQLAKVAERERIGRDLHDLLGHTLSLIILKSELASKLADKDPARAAAEIRDVERISREALAEVRQAVKGYRSSGLANEFRSAEEMLRTAGIRTTTLMDPVALTPAQEGAVVLAIREAVTNVVRHAQARSCDLRFERTGSGLLLVVADDGCGGAAPEGSGLSGMRQRVEMLGGTLERDGAQGTRLTIRIPVSNVRSIGAA